MARRDWMYALSQALTLALVASAIWIIMFALGERRIP
jgi:thiol:disulfide interchange protein